MPNSVDIWNEGNESKPRGSGWPITPMPKAKYNGTHCPFPDCESRNIMAIEQVQVDGSGANQHCECHDCGRDWYDMYELTGWEEIA